MSITLRTINSYEKNSLIFVKHSEILAPKVQNRWNFFNIFFRYQNINFFVFCILTVRGSLMNNFGNFLQCKAKIPMNSTLLEFCWYLLQFLRYKIFNFHFFNSVLHSVLKMWCPNKVFALKIILFFFIFKDNLEQFFSAESWDIQYS